MDNIYKISLVDILPPNLREDQDIIAAAKAIDGDFYLIVDSVEKCILLPNIYDITDHDLLDLLAWDRHVDYYDTSLSIEQKQEIIDISLKQHMKKGTPAAVEDLVAAIFGSGEVVEWFQYGGTPYHFKVNTSNDSATNEKAEEFIAAVNSVKNLRSHLEKVTLTITDTMHLYYGNVIHIGDYIRLRQVM